MSGTRNSVFFIFFLVFGLIACGGGRNSTETRALAAPGDVSLGMTRQDVLQAMLEEVQLLQMSGQVTNPYATRYLQNIDGESLEVMYYYTGMKKGDDLVTEEELVPVILKDNAVIGWGWESLEDMVGSKPVPGSQNVEPGM